ncbi:MAG: KH domain-containing protein [Candidatus Woesearchaeota archaeon]|jgi:ribosomal RNA assembly protein
MTTRLPKTKDKTAKVEEKADDVEVLKEKKNSKVSKKSVSKSDSEKVKKANSNIEKIALKDDEKVENYGYFDDKNEVVVEESEDDIIENTKEVLISDSNNKNALGEQEFSYDLKIPKDRLGVLIGKNGIMKTQLERETECKIDVDSKEGEVFIFGTDGLKLFIAKNIITAIGRGFNPQVALQLLKPDYSFELIDLNQFGRKDQHERLKGRVIGREGRCRGLIEEFTASQICVYGKTVGLIGRVEYVMTAKRACVSLLEGSTHASIYKWLERKRREMRLNDIKSTTNTQQ